MNRVVFLVDGFNLYHSIREAAGATGLSLKWLDLPALCRSYMSMFGRGATLDRIIYFSAYANFLRPKDPHIVERHRTYVTALQAGGVETVMSRFKWKPRWCSTCQRENPGHEEKETDVAIAVKLMELFAAGVADTAVLVTGDTDLLPAVRTARSLYPDKQVWVATPHKRANADLGNAADGVITIKRRKYEKHQLPDPLKLPDGSEIRKPSDW